MGSIETLAPHQDVDRSEADATPVRVLHFISEPRSWHFFDGQPEFLRSIGYEFIAVSAPGPLLERFAETNNISAYPVPIVRNISVFRDVISTVRLLRVLRKVRPHILHAHFSKPGIVGMIAGLLGRVPVRIYHNHGMALSSSRGWKRLMLWAVERASCSLAHRVIYVAPSVLQDALKMRVCSVRKGVSILSANGLDTSSRFTRRIYGTNCREQQRRLFNIPASAFVVGYVGRILKIKGIEELVRAWQSLAPGEPSLHLLFAGSFDPRAPISAWAREVLASEPRIHLAGFVQEPAAVYLAMDVLVLPSHHEGLGYSLIEAAAMETAVIGTRIPGIVDAVHEGKNGVLVEPGNHEELAAAIRTYLGNPQLLERHGKAGREFAAFRFQRSSVWEHIHQVYEEALAERRTKRQVA